MSLRRGGLELRSLVDHSSAAYIASFCTSGPHLDRVISHYNSCVEDCDTLSITSLKDNSPNQKKLSDSIEALQFNYSSAQVPQQTGHDYYPSPPLILQHGSL